MKSVILTDATAKIRKFNDMGLHYNLVADQIYKQRLARTIDPFAISFLPYIVAGLISFDMGRMMGDKPYEMDGDHFALRLYRKLQSVGPLLKTLINATLTQINLQQQRASVIEAYNVLSARGNGALHMDSKKSFPVGATKILHFLNPQLFVMVDSNAARAFKMAHRLPFKNSTQPGYSAELYMKCMEHAQEDILDYGLESFQALEPNIPITRIYDKLTFITGLDSLF